MPRSNAVHTILACQVVIRIDHRPSLLAQTPFRRLCKEGAPADSPGPRSKPHKIIARFSPSLDGNGETRGVLLQRGIIPLWRKTTFSQNHVLNKWKTNPDIMKCLWLIVERKKEQHRRIIAGMTGPGHHLWISHEAQFPQQQADPYQIQTLERIESKNSNAESHKRRSHMSLRPILATPTVPAVVHSPRRYAIGCSTPAETHTSRQSRIGERQRAEAR
jgi:hypothetical protein